MEYKSDGSSVSGPKPIELEMHSGAVLRGLQKHNLDADLPCALPPRDPPENEAETQAETAEATKTNRTSASRETDLVSRLAEKKLNPQT
jgi:hypothetical protein